MSYEPAWDHGAPWAGSNAGTICWSPLSPPRPRLPAAALFAHHFTALRFLRETHALDGFLVVPIFDPATLGPYAHVPVAGDPSASTLVVGRHTRATLYLDRDPTVALRHVVVRVRPGELGRPTIRLIDLNTGQGFELDGLGRCETAVCDGPLIARVGGYTLFFFPTTADQAPWPTSAEEVWRSAPRTVVTDLRKLNRLPAARLVQPRHTTLVLFPGPIALTPQAPAAPSGPYVGRITLRDDRGIIERPVHRDELERGLLVGRYERCSLRSSEEEVVAVVSRVHLLLTVEGDQVLAVDTASTNGSFCNGSPLGATYLPDRVELNLAATLELAWCRGGCEPSAPRPDNPDPTPAPPTADNEGPDAAPPDAAPPPLEVVRSAADRPAPARPRFAFPFARVGRLSRRASIALTATGVVVGLLLVRLLLGALLAPPHDEALALHPPPAPQCIDPTELFGADTPALRLFLSHQMPGVCFIEKWRPERAPDEELEE